jgi:hypothetical protein
LGFSEFCTSELNKRWASSLFISKKDQIILGDFERSSPGREPIILVAATCEEAYTGILSSKG